MDKAILDIVNDFSAWRGNPFTLASLVAEQQRELCETATAPPEPEAQPEGG